VFLGQCKIEGGVMVHPTLDRANSRARRGLWHRHRDISGDVEFRCWREPVSSNWSGAKIPNPNKQTPGKHQKEKQKKWSGGVV
jgi:hypothetical protein